MKIFLILMLISFFSQASVMEEQCTREADANGGLNTLSHECEEWILANARVRKKAANYSLYGWRHVFIYRGKFGMSILTGPNTSLTEILDATHDESAGKIYILNQTKESRQLLVFERGLKGDVAPNAVIDSPQLRFVSGLFVSTNKDIVIGKTEQGELFWDITKDSRVLGPASPLDFNR
jgi:hypothetical protein